VRRGDHSGEMDSHSRPEAEAAADLGCSRWLALGEDYCSSDAKGTRFLGLGSEATSQAAGKTDDASSGHHHQLAGGTGCGESRLPFHDGEGTGSSGIPCLDHAAPWLRR